jgi:hypothetical protein
MLEEPYRVAIWLNSESVFELLQQKTVMIRWTKVRVAP